MRGESEGEGGRRAANRGFVGQRPECVNSKRRRCLFRLKDVESQSESVQTRAPEHGGQKRKPCWHRKWGKAGEKEGEPEPLDAGGSFQAGGSPWRPRSSDVFLVLPPHRKASM